ncbi:hypothetical protein SAMN06893096_105108 [Geodermatophilus pulveris]|uniref:Uncharacterized protein n=1 Tax=Geodermatophilus pulveris TaxID=1564159 RepID=A0A239FIB6_9ACTN|nr:hypothetical protein SAMN06893096_105108 [Geodermatophilus pulveris]
MAELGAVAVTALLEEQARVWWLWSSVAAMPLR